MASKIWKKVGFFILIFACLFNITYKLVKKIPFKEELQTSIQYLQDKSSEKNK